MDTAASTVVVAYAPKAHQTQHDTTTPHPPSPPKKAAGVRVRVNIPVGWPGFDLGWLGLALAPPARPRSQGLAGSFRPLHDRDRSSSSSSLLHSCSSALVCLLLPSSSSRFNSRRSLSRPKVAIFSPISLIILFLFSLLSAVAFVWISSLHR